MQTHITDNDAVAVDTNMQKWHNMFTRKYQTGADHSTMQITDAYV